MFTEVDVSEKVMHTEIDKIEISILSLLPHSIKTQLNDQSKKLNILKLLKFLAKELNETLSLFESKKLFIFDPHVGDTLCQIRAYKILLLFCEGLPEIKFKPEVFIHLIELKIREFENFIQEKKGRFCRELDKNEGIYEFLKRKDLIFEIPQDLIFLVQTKILSDFSKVDEEGISRGIDYDKFSIKASITKNLSKKIMHYYQQSLARLSSHFLMDLLGDLPELNKLQDSFYQLQKMDKDGRLVLPCYEATKILIKHIIKNEKPVLLAIERRCGNECDILNLLFVANKTHQKFYLINDMLAVEKIPCIIIKGVTKYRSPELMEKKSCFIDRLTKLGIENVIMTNMACHPQYSAPELHYLNEDPYFSFVFSENEQSQTFQENMQLLKDEFLEMKRRGQLLGCCIENPFLLLVRHVFCNFTNCYQLI